MKPLFYQNYLKSCSGYLQNTHPEYLTQCKYASHEGVFLASAGKYRNEKLCSIYHRFPLWKGWDMYDTGFRGSIYVS
jgi:hypothetical protein